MPGTLPGTVASPNIRDHPRVYELLNRAADPHGVIPAALVALRDFSGAVVVDIGCGSGFHLPWLATVARHVVGIEPEHSLVDLARGRTAHVGNIEVHRATAQAMPLADASVDVVHARWAYFFGPGCEPGLAEASRVLRPGGLHVIIDVDTTASWSPYVRWFRQAWPRVDPRRVEAFWLRHGFQRQALDVVWRFGARDDLAAVLAIEFPPAVAAAAISECKGRRAIGVSHVVRWRVAAAPAGHVRPSP